MSSLLFYLFLQRDSTNFAAFPRVRVEARFTFLGAPGKQFAVRSDKVIRCGPRYVRAPSGRATPKKRQSFPADGISEAIRRFRTFSDR